MDDRNGEGHRDPSWQCTMMTMTNPTFEGEFDTFFYAKFHSYILVALFYCVYQNPPVFFFFWQIPLYHLRTFSGWSREFVIWLPHVYFFSTWLCEIISITFNSDESESPRNLPLWIFTSVGFVLLLSIPQSSFSRHL